MLSHLMFHALRTSMDSDCCDVSTLRQLLKYIPEKKTLERVTCAKIFPFSCLGEVYGSRTHVLLGARDVRQQ